MYLDYYIFIAENKYLRNLNTEILEKYSTLVIQCLLRWGNLQINIDAQLEIPIKTAG